MKDRDYDLEELSDLADVTPRTIRYYIAEDLVDPPRGRGRSVKKYGTRHLNQLLLIKKMQNQLNLPLEAIGQALEHLDEAGVRALLATLEAEASQAGVEHVRSDEGLTSAQSYLQALRGGPQPAGGQRPPEDVLFYSNAPSDRTRSYNQFSTSPPRSRHESLSIESLGLPTWDKPAQWDHITLTPNIEIHAKRSLDKPERLALRRLLAFAATIFTEESI